jgi:leucyl aminopeptidase
MFQGFPQCGRDNRKGQFLLPLRVNRIPKVRKIMAQEITQILKPPSNVTVVLLAPASASLPVEYFSKGELSYISSAYKRDKQEFFSFTREGYWVYVQMTGQEDNRLKRKEKLRIAGDKLGKLLNELKRDQIVIYDTAGQVEETLAFAEGLALGEYQFLKYKGKKDKQNTLNQIHIYCQHMMDGDLNRLAAVVGAVNRCRNLVNEPNSYLTAVTFAEEVEKLAASCGAGVEVLNKSKIEALKMGGLLAVNKGSVVPPTFTIMEWKPKNAVNTKPYVFVGKGIVFDSGGMNLKPGDSMSTMKDDMSGAAAVAAAIYAIARAGLPVHVIGLMPATDNRPGPEAIVPGDIIAMQNGMTVEVLNTDAEGRLILADALNHATKYDPALVIDLATLTGSAVRAVGKFGIVAMQKGAEKELELLKESGWETYERLVEFPGWDEYDDGLKSELADMKNVGPAEAGAITAGKFLERFTAYPYIHLDIAGPAFLEKRDSYRGQGGTGVGVRLLFDFMRKVVKQSNKVTV